MDSYFSLFALSRVELSIFFSSDNLPSSDSFLPRPFAAIRASLLRFFINDRPLATESALIDSDSESVDTGRRLKERAEPETL
jgi:hypothetical protein